MRRKIHSLCDCLRDWLEYFCELSEFFFCEEKAASNYDVTEEVRKKNYFKIALRFGAEIRWKFQSKYATLVYFISLGTVPRLNQDCFEKKWTCFRSHGKNFVLASFSVLWFLTIFSSTFDIVFPTVT
jgi:hypothetical protein